GVTKAGESAADTGEDERQRDGRAGALGNGVTRSDEKASANYRPDSEGDEVQRAELTGEAIPACSFGLLDQRVDRFCCEQGVAHATPPLTLHSLRNSSWPWQTYSCVTKTNKRANQAKR